MIFSDLIFICACYQVMHWLGYGPVSIESKSCYHMYHMNMNYLISIYSIYIRLMILDLIEPSFFLPRMCA